MTKKIIILSGKQFSGKDTVAKFLLEFMPDFKRIGLGDAIKLEYGKQKGLTFEEIWKQKTGQVSEGLRFSKHAANRLADRSITLSDNQMERLTEGARKAGEKGIRESLVMVDQLAFIVNVPSKTVVTAMDQSQSNDSIFTNIDGAVIM